MLALQLYNFPSFFLTSILDPFTWKQSGIKQLLLSKSA